MTHILKQVFTQTLIIAVLSLPFSQQVMAAPGLQFQSESAAQQHCPSDTVVWVNTNTGVYHFKGQRWYGNTKKGAYECRPDANGEGDRATRNGQ